MIKKIVLKNFKRFQNSEIDIHPNTISYLVGGNNSGKSSLLHALSIWEFCKNVVKYEKGENALLENFKGVGYGINIDDFTPLNIPSFKYLWYNLSPRPGYSLSITCFWDDPNSAKECYLEMSLSLVQERLFIKNGGSNLTINDHIPKIAYLSPFAGISDKEQWYSYAMRLKLIGQGLAGAVLRNEIVELHKSNLEQRAKMKEGRSKLKHSDLQLLRANDPFELLQQVLLRTFGGIMSVTPFDMNFHTHVNVMFCRGHVLPNLRFSPDKRYNKRDIMVEGSGFLQWLSVYTFALSPNVDFLLLDEPDAHLHTSLQSLLIHELEIIAKKFGKQMLIATHSNEVIKSVSHTDILHVKADTSVHYLRTDLDKTVVLSGLGTEYFPLFDKIVKTRRVLFVENSSDARLLQIWAEKFMSWPANLCVWPIANHHKERKQIFLRLGEIFKDDLACMSLSDKDTNSYENITNTLKENDRADLTDSAHKLSLKYRTWRRSEIENYLIDPIAIARAVCNNKSQSDFANVVKEIRQFIGSKCSILIPEEGYRISERSIATRPLFELPGKEIIDAIENEYGIDKYDIAMAMNADEVFEDVHTLCVEIGKMCGN